ncbi:MAG: hypothetical protein E7017_02980 [Alphaproteobacteria bacterium]|nr:hypothetical protein [Alphaproteobacteria bacterium]
MSIFGQYQTPLGYKISENGIDTYGVNHTKFSIQDELNYQFARDKREKQIIAELNKQGITENYPQYGTNFWNRSSDNNFGFGEDNVQENIEKFQSSYWETALQGKNIYNNVIAQEGNILPKEQNSLSYSWSALKTVSEMIKNYLRLKNYRYTDKYKHAYINCVAAQNGRGGTDVAEFLSGLKEKRDIKSGANSFDESQSDDYANKIGRLLGNKYPQGDCDEIIQKYIKKNR